MGANPIISLGNLVPRALRVRSSRQTSRILQILLAREHGNGSVFQNGALQFPSFYWLFGARCVSVSQVRALEAVYLGKDVLGVLPTGCGKSLIFQLIPNLVAFKKHILCCTSGTVEWDSCSDTDSSSASDDEKLLAIDSETATQNKMCNSREQCEKPIRNKNRIKTIKPTTNQSQPAPGCFSRGGPWGQGLNLGTTVFGLRTRQTNYTENPFSTDDTLRAVN